MTKSSGYCIIFLMSGVRIAYDPPRLVDETKLAKSPISSADSIAKAVADSTLFFVMQQGAEKMFQNLISRAGYKRRQLVAVTKQLAYLDGFT